ncbi:MAG TPA: hypothetical protein VE631_02040, partial [Alphaproteobacteria bacterium]|nr:hypothetical protein [Alphaproteobacteria bacterium]
MESIVGRIRLVQENRFLLEDETGHTSLFVLSPSSAIEPDDLRASLDGDRSVSVRYSAADGKVASIAHSIELLGAGGDGGESIARGGLGRLIRGFLRDWSLPRQMVGQSG